MVKVSMRGQEKAPVQVAGGYLVMSVPQLVLPWQLYAEKRLQLLDVRVWFACAEMSERRRFTEVGREPAYKLAEVAKLVGAKGLSRVRAALKRLREVGLIAWDGKILQLATSPDQVGGDLSGFWETLGLVENQRRKVPVPRRIARHLAGGASRAETAVILAHLLRCCYMRDGAVKAIGNCLASWVAEVFGVHATRVKQARARLVRLGMFHEQVMPQWHRNRYGNRIEVNLSWSREAIPAAVGEGDAAGTTGTESRPPVAVIHTQSATAIEVNRSLPTEGSKNQNPGSEPRTPTGVSERTARKEAEAQPSLVHVVEQDLTSNERLLTLHAEAVQQGLAPEGERGELEFVALAEHARAYATSNAPGMFAWLVRNYERTAKRFITQDDEEAARRRLTEHRTAVPSSHRPARAASTEQTREPASVADYLQLVLVELAGRGAAKTKAER